MPSPTLELVGDWTSARLLIRLMMVIDSPWQLSAAGLTHRDTGETCLLEMRPRDDTVLDLFKAEECPVRPSLGEDTLAGIAGHHTVLTVRPAPELVGWDGARAVLRCGAGLVDAGALAVRCVTSGLAHSAERWQTMERMAGAAEADGNRSMLAETLYLAFVHPLVQDGPDWQSRGMALLEAPDVKVPHSVAAPNALDAIEALCLRTLSGTAPAEGATLRASPSSPSFTIERLSRPPPYGLWRLTP